VIARLHPCRVGTVEIRRVGASLGQWQVRVLRNCGKGGDRKWWPGHYRSAFEALKAAAHYEGQCSMRDFYSDPPEVTA
jgi:hypothetical protein